MTTPRVDAAGPSDIASGTGDTIKDVSVKSSTPHAFFQSLTDEERAWLRDHPVIRVVQDPGWPPIEFADDRGRGLGMTGDYLKIIEQQLGIRFERITNLSWQESYARLKTWDLDMTTSVTVTPDRSKFWAFTRPYMDIPIVILSKANVPYIAGMRDLAGKTVAVVDGYAVNEWVPRDFPEIRLVKVATAEAGIRLVQKGEAFAFIDNMLVIGYYLSKLKMMDLKIAGETPYMNSQSMAVRKDWAILAGILQKALDSISEPERDEIYRKWVPIRYEHGFNYGLLLQAVAVFAAIVLGLVVWNRKMSREIGHRKAAEAALRESESRYRALFEEGPDGVVVLNPETGRIVEFNDQVCRQLGYSRKEFALLSVEDVEASEKAGEIRNHIQKIIREGRDDFETLQRSKEGEIRHIHVTAQVIDAGGSSLYHCIWRDITDRKNAEETLRENDAFIQAIMDNLPIGIAVNYIEPSVRFVYMNDKFPRYYRTTREALTSPDAFWEAVYEDPVFREEIKKRVMDDCAGGDPERMSWAEVPITRNGAPTSYVTSRNILIPHRQLMISTVWDVTDHKAAEDERRKLEERLQRAEKMEALGTLAGGVAHDINNVLGIVVGYSEMLLVDLEKSRPEGRQAMEILKAGQRAAAIVQDLLTLARRGVPNRAVVNLNDVLVECLNSPELANLRSFHPKVLIQTDLQTDLLNVAGSSVHLGKSFINLVSNAAEAMTNGGVLRIGTRNQYLDNPVVGYDEVEQGDYVVLTVSDNGEGIPAADLKRIFEPFYTKKVMGRSGTGLGLAVVWGTVKDHCGYINVESEEGKGTTFALYFPVTREEITPERISASLSEYIGKGESILIVDDIKEQRDLATSMLKKLHYRVASVSGGEEAVDYVKRHNPDLLVLDMIMDPGMDGLDTYLRIQEIRSDQRAIIVSGFAETERVSKAQSLGAGPYVKKPYVLEKLGLAVRKELDRER